MTHVGGPALDDHGSKHEQENSLNEDLIKFEDVQL